MAGISVFAPLAASLINEVAIDSLAAIGAITVVALLIYLGYVLGRADIFGEDQEAN